MENYIIALLGKSGCGKDTVLKEIEKLGYKRIVSCTTRPKRQGEVEGFDYYFLNEHDFMSKANDFIEYRQYTTFDSNDQPDIWRYGIERKEVDLAKHKYVVVVDYKGFNDLKMFSNRVFGIYIDAPAEQRLERAKQRDPNFSLKEWGRREEDDKQVFKNLSGINAIVYNEDGYLEKTMDSIKSVLSAIELL